VVPVPAIPKVLLKVDNCLCPLLKLGTLHLDGVLKLDDPVGTDIHLMTCDVEELTVVVPPMLGLTKTMIRDLPLTVLIQR
jgi:hypothetical protein